MQKFSVGRILKQLSNLQLAISLLFLIGGVISLGTFIEQEQNLNFYKTNYPTTSPILGFIDWKFITFLSLDKIYTAPWFLLILFLFAISLLACTLTVQLPSLKGFRIWKFFSNLSSLKGIEDKLLLEDKNIFASQLHARNYHIFKQGKNIYAYSGLLGRLGPIVVHASIILLLIGSTIGSFTGYTSQEIVPRGEIFHTQNLIQSGSLNYLPQNLSWRVNDFWITYTKEFKTNQFYSDISLLEVDGREIKRKTIFVNEPLIFNGLNLYQTDWDILGLKVKTENNKTIQIPLKKIVKGRQKFWFGSLPVNNSGKSISLVVNDLQGKVYLYNEKGILLAQPSVGETFLFDSTHSFTFLDFLTSTGLQLKVDPGIKTVYFSFFLLIFSIYVSFISYNQIWGIEKSPQIDIAGKSNRAVLFFQDEFRKMKKQSTYKSDIKNLKI
jgi:cytochrome c biogenesis protein